MGRKLDAGRQAILDRLDNLQRCNKNDDCAILRRGVWFALEDFDYAIAKCGEIAKYNGETAAGRLKR